MRSFLLTVVAALIDAKSTDVRIIGGRPAVQGEFPYQVSIRRSYNDQHYCGGTLITPKHVLTAAHCMFYRWGGVLPPNMVSITAGQLELQLRPDTIYRNATNITVHDGYDDNTMANDIAVVELNETMPFNSLVAVIPLNDRKVTSNVKCFVSGWGTQNFSETVASAALLAVEVDIVALADCQNRYRVIDVELFDGMLCATNEQKPGDACQGDSGGPLACEGHLVGVISSGNDCGDSRYPGIYSDVSYYLPWIKEVVGVDFLEESTLSTDGASTLTVVTTDRSELQTVANNSSLSFVIVVFNLLHLASSAYVPVKLPYLIVCLLFLAVFRF